MLPPLTVDWWNNMTLLKTKHSVTSGQKLHLVSLNKIFSNYLISSTTEQLQNYMEEEKKLGKCTQKWNTPHDD